MPRDGNGNYSLPAGNPVASGTVILATWANSTMTDLANEMTNSLSRDGSGGMLAPLGFVDGDVVQPAIAFNNESSLGIFRPQPGVIAFAAGSAEKARVKLDGNISVTGAAPAVDADLTRKDYVDTAVTDKVNRSGDQMTGQLGGVGPAPVAPEDLTRKDYVDAQIIAGDTFPERLDGYLDTGLHETYVGDLNAINVNSSYSVRGDQVTNEPDDYGQTSWGVIHTDLWAADTRGVQVIVGYNGDNIYKQWQRGFDGATWDAWKLVVDGGAFPQRLAGYLDTGFHEAFTGDLDTVIANSTYSIGAGSTNLPDDYVDGGTILSTEMGVNANAGSQTLRGFTLTSENKIWERSSVGGVWGAWESAVGGATIAQLPPDNPSNGQTWWPDDTGTSYIWYEDSDSGQWVEQVPFKPEDSDTFNVYLAGYLDTGFHENYTGDLNDIARNSAYRIQGAQVTNEPSDYDSSGWGFIVTYKLANATNSTQIIYGMNGTNIYRQWMRRQDGGGFQPWKLVVDGGAFTERLAGYLDTGLHETYLGDLNDINYNANYYIYANGVTNNPPIAEFNGPMNLSVDVRNDTNAVLQTVVGMNTPAQYMTAQRLYQGGTWGDWKLIIDGGAFTQRLAGYADTGLSETYTGDLNAIIVNSKFDILGTGVTNEPSDFVASRRGWVMTMMNPTVTTFATQVIYGNNNENANKIWMRTKDNGTWAAWKLVVDGGAFTERLAGYQDTGFTEGYSGNLDQLIVNGRYDISAGNVTGEPADFFDNGFLEIMANLNGTFVLQRLSGYTGASVNKIWQRVLGSAWTLVVGA